jgi:hypothetical protein
MLIACVSLRHATDSFLGQFQFFRTKLSFRRTTTTGIAPASNKAITPSKTSTEMDSLLPFALSREQLWKVSKRLSDFIVGGLATSYDKWRRQAPGSFSKADNLVPPGAKAASLALSSTAPSSASNSFLAPLDFLDDFLDDIAFTSATSSVACCSCC